MKTTKRPKKFEVVVRQIGSKQFWGGTVKFSNIEESKNKSQLQLAIETVEHILLRMKTDLAMWQLGEKLTKDLYTNTETSKRAKIVGLSKQVKGKKKDKAK